MYVMDKRKGEIEKKLFEKNDFTDKNRKEEFTC